MPTQNPIAPKGKPKTGMSAKTAGGHAKILGVDWRIAGAGLVLAIVAGLYLRNKLDGSSTTTGTAAASPTDTTGTSGGASVSPDQTTNQATEDLATALSGLTSLLSSGANFGIIPNPGASTGTIPLPDPNGQPNQPVDHTGGSSSSGASGPSPSYTSAVQVASQTGAGIYVNPKTGDVLVGQDAKGAAAAPGYVNVSQPIPVATTDFAHAATQRSAALQAAGVSAPFGGVVSTTTNKKTGVVTTTYASGRVVQQAPGKTAYVAKK